MTVVAGTVSVIIPCWNAEAWLADAIHSALDQGPVTPEIVVVDDGSTDDSLAVARTFGNRIRLFTGTNQGVSAARNRGIAETSGEWIVFLDADDLLSPDTLTKRLQTVAVTECDVVVCDWRDFVKTDVGLFEHPVRSVDLKTLQPDRELATALYFWVATPALMYRRSMVERIGGFQEDLPVTEDARMLFESARRGARFARSSHLGAGVRVRPNSLSRGDPALFWNSALLKGSQIEAIWREEGSFGADRRRAIAEIYNGAAHGLFRAADPNFRNAITRLRASELPITVRNRLALLLADALGVSKAAAVAAFWTRLRRRIEGVTRGHAPIRPAPNGA